MENNESIQNVIVGKTYKNGNLERTVSKIDRYEIYYIDSKGKEKHCFITTFQDWIRAGEKKVEKENKPKKPCWICNNEMILTETKEIKTIGLCEIFKCSKCTEVVYHPLKNK